MYKYKLVLQIDFNIIFIVRINFNVMAPLLAEAPCLECCRRPSKDLDSVVPAQLHT